MSAVSFIWEQSEPDELGRVMIRERMEGTDKMNEYGPLPARYVDSFIRARRDFVSRFMSKQAALRIFEPRPQLLDIARQQRKPRYDD